MYLALIVLAQLIFSLTDAWKKMILATQPFDFKLFLNPSFVLALALPMIALGIYLFVLAHYDLSRSAVTLGVSSVLLSSLLGVLVFHESLTPINIVGYVCAVAAVILVNWR